MVAGMDESIEALLAGDPTGMSHQQRLDQLAELDRLAARVAARTQLMLAAIDTDPPAMLPATPAAVRDKAFVREEVACLLRWSPAVTGTRMREAAELVARLPRTLADLEAGRFSVWHVRSLLEAPGPCPRPRPARWNNGCCRAWVSRPQQSFAAR